MVKSLLILVALTAGLFLPGLAGLSFTIRPFLMTLLYFSFLGVRLDRSVFHRSQFGIALLLPPVALTAYFLGQLHSPELAITLLLMGIAPTAVITPVLAGIMRKDVGYLIGAILLTHVVVAVTVPLLLPWLLGLAPTPAQLGELFASIAGTVFVPLLLAEGTKRYGGRILPFLRRHGGKSFLLFLSNLTVASATLSAYVREHAGVGADYLLVTTAALLVLLLFNFGLGAALAPRRLAVEGSLGLGRKNTMLAIWIALEFVNPLAVLGPMLYILLQNLLVAGQIFYLARTRVVTTDPSAGAVPHPVPPR